MATVDMNLPTPEGAIAVAAFDSKDLTREHVIATALADPIFVTALAQLKAAEGFGPTKIHIKDDHGSDEFFDVEDVIVVVAFDDSGLPSNPWPTSIIQDGHTHLPAWIMPAEIEKRGERWDWNVRNKNPVYVHSDGKVHLSKMATGADIQISGKDKELDTIIRKNRGVYTMQTWRGKSYEAHVWLTVAELATL